MNDIKFPLAELCLAITGCVLFVGFILGLEQKQGGDTYCTSPLRRIEYIAPAVRIGCHIGYAADWLFSVPQ